MHEACKCCGGATRPFAEIDAARSCEDRHGVPVFAASGRPIAYRRCVVCGFVATRDFDSLSEAEMGAVIYDADYIRADPDFTATRPRYYAALFMNWLRPVFPTPAALDFGGGAGVFAAAMAKAGFRFGSWDPYFDTSPRPAATYDLVTAFEVMEHSRDPLRTVREATGFLQPGGVLAFSTQLLPAGADAGWWYLAPRNGHVSIHTPGSLRHCAAACGFDLMSVSNGLHLFLPRPLSSLARQMMRHQVRAALYDASLRGPSELWHVARQAARAGALRPALDPRHLARALLRSRGR
jgi:2-polyprenyl-6-hydroxyphenyl methylase/3-demethylubiquinone-9 3-methyltransferase